MTRGHRVLAYLFARCQSAPARRMWIVRLALRRPYTIAVLAVLILLGGGLSIRSMLVDVFPVIDIPVVAVVWQYNGLPAEDVERRVTFISERSYSTAVSGIERIESKSIPGMALLKIYFQPGSDIGAAIAQISASSNTALRIMPPGMQPPVIVQFNASNVPVAQLTASSRTLSEDRIFDYGLNFIRLKLFTVPGLSTPAPFGGRQRQVDVDMNMPALQARGLSPVDVVNALQTSNLIVPAGTSRMGATEYNVFMNSSPPQLTDLERIPLRIQNGAPILLGDVAKVRDAFADQTNIVHVDGRRATYLSILRKADASTLAVVDAAREMLPQIQAAAPEGLELKIDFDQSSFVRRAIGDVLREAALASLLVSLMILVFLGSWRSVLIVCTSIPLAILVGVAGLKLLGQTLNIMTLGGLSLAIGMLVDDATVEVENIHRNRHLGKSLTVAILDGAQQVAVPAIVATLSICIVFFPVALLVGPSRYLFVPLALSVVLSMLASYVLSRTLVPVLARMLMQNEKLGEEHRSWLGRVREAIFGGLQRGYLWLLGLVLHYRIATLLVAAGISALTMQLPESIGADFFPQVDTGLMKLHVRAPAGMRIEETDKLVLRVEAEIRKIIPASELRTLNAMVGVPLFFNLAFVQTENTSGMDAELLIALQPGHAPSESYMRTLRERLPELFPATAFWFQPADIVSQVINFGVAAPIDVEIESRDLNKANELAKQLVAKMRAIPGVVDVRVPETLNYPALQVDVDRLRAAELGLAQRDVANAVLIALSSSALVSPNFYVNPSNNVNYPVVVRVPQGEIRSIDELAQIPVTSPSASQLLVPSDVRAPTSVPEAPSARLGSIAKVTPRTSLNQVSHSTIQRVLHVDANVAGRDLGHVADAVDAAIAGLGKLPPGIKITMHGQPEVMRMSFRTMGLGLVLAIALVYLLMVVLFQTWLDPFIILTAVPGALVGILWLLAATGTTLNVESLMGAIMAVGIAVANAILLVSFANEFRAQTGADALAGALEAGKTRLRPVLMTALAMILGMLPMAIGHGEGGEQNAPLGRAVIGGLLMATVVTLFIVPVVYTLLRKQPPRAHELDARFAEESRGAAAESMG